VSLDGQHFVMIKRTAATEAPPLIVVEHWFQSLQLLEPVVAHANGEWRLCRREDGAA